ncbi:periplasmic chaperone for outer membrane proteins Skp [Thalassovita litoralis]|jgi:Skp family chaperone for outer membrane proteins|uniref:Periplasmic chaperone for outer membrane proteins Skp n=1 Tax=Thalassovita litoralis TaxID=1010611 RepID=A0A521BVI5_9RHOB|nr:OmpH family outer membrane protein [Thalassovita litoralis]SMO51207.1 periplasmic chaperone for outer membrane proteins Skp [Thalassovita litoralis]
MRIYLEKGLAMLALLLLLTTGATAQEGGSIVQSPVLTIDSDRMFAASAFGQRVAQDFEAQGKVLETENRRIEAELIAEEKDLTTKRATLPPERFRALADAFDAKVETIRSEQNAKTRALTQTTDTARRQFLIAARPVLEQLMQETNAAIIVERRSIFLSARAIDITDLAIERLNAQIGDGSDLPKPDQATDTQSDQE